MNTKDIEGAQANTLQKCNINQLKILEEQQTLLIQNTNF